MEIFVILLYQKTKKTPMTVSNPKEVPEYELNPLELEFRRGEEVTKACLNKLPPFVFSFCTVSFFMYLSYLDKSANNFPQWTY